MTIAVALLVLTISFALGFGFMAYPALAHEYGVPIRDWTGGGLSRRIAAALVTMIASVGVAAWQIGWMSAVLVVVLGVPLAALMVYVFRERFQAIGALLPFVAALVIFAVRVPI